MPRDYIENDKRQRVGYVETTSTKHYAYGSDSRRLAEYDPKRDETTFANLKRQKGDLLRFAVLQYDAEKRRKAEDDERAKKQRLEEDATRRKLKAERDARDKALAAEEVARKKKQAAEDAERQRRALAEDAAAEKKRKAADDARKRANDADEAARKRRMQNEDAARERELQAERRRLRDEAARLAARCRQLNREQLDEPSTELDDEVEEDDDVAARSPSRRSARPPRDASRRTKPMSRRSGVAVERGRPAASRGSRQDDEPAGTSEVPLGGEWEQPEHHSSVDSRPTSAVVVLLALVLACAAGYVWLQRSAAGSKVVHVPDRSRPTVAKGTGTERTPADAAAPASPTATRAGTVPPVDGAQAPAASFRVLHRHGLATLPDGALDRLQRGVSSAPDGFCVGTLSFADNVVHFSTADSSDGRRDNVNVDAAVIRKAERHGATRMRLETAGQGDWDFYADADVVSATMVAVGRIRGQ